MPSHDLMALSLKHECDPYYQINYFKHIDVSRSDYVMYTYVSKLIQYRYFSLNRCAAKVAAVFKIFVIPMKFAMFIHIPRFPGCT